MAIAATASAWSSFICATIQASAAKGGIMIMDEQGRSAMVTIADVDQSNGVIHVIDDVLLPAPPT